MSGNKLQTAKQRLDALHKRLAEHSLSAHWLRRDPRPQLKAWVWHWSVIYSCLQEAGEVMELGSADQANNRRTISLVNPGLGRGTSRTLQVSVQLVKPGERAECHRHTVGALRFVIESTGTYTTVEGERLLMEPGDLVLTPSWTWHDHANFTSDQAIWLDVLDAHLTGHLDAGLTEIYGEGTAQPITKPDGYSRNWFWRIRPRVPDISSQALPYVYKWTEARQALEEMAAAGESDPYDGVLLEYTNLVTGGPTMPTIGCWVQMLRPGEATRAHRHMGSTIYHTMAGHGVTAVGRGGDSQDLEWSARDCFFVPPWQWHQHRNASTNEPAFLFSVTDRPVLQLLSLYREEKG